MLGITRYRYKATEEQIKNACQFFFCSPLFNCRGSLLLRSLPHPVVRKKVLKHHPDKKAQAGGSVDDDGYFKCLQKGTVFLSPPFD